MDRKELIEILLSLPIDGTLLLLYKSEIETISTTAYHQLNKQGYIDLRKDEQGIVVAASLTRLGVDWVIHHKSMAQTPNISL